MDVRRLQLLRELADRGSVTAVAEATHRTASAVSQQLKVLEAEVGVPLTERRGRGLVLTGAGLALADTARRIAVAIEAAEALWQEFAASPQGIVTVSQATTPFLQPLLDGHVQGLSTDRGTEFVLRVFWQLADACLRGLREINAGVEALENELKRSIRNEEVLGLLDFQNMSTSLVLVPLAPLGVWLGVRFVRHVPQKLFYGLFELGMLLTGLKLLWDGLLA